MIEKKFLYNLTYFREIWLKVNANDNLFANLTGTIFVGLKTLRPIQDGGDGPYPLLRHLIILSIIIINYLFACATILKTNEKNLIEILNLETNEEKKCTYVYACVRI